MLRSALVLFVLLGLAPAVAAKPAPPQHLTPAQRDSIVRAIEKDRAATDDWLRFGATSYLATVIRVDFGKTQTLTVGRAPDNGVVVADAEMPEHALRVTVLEDSFHVESADPGVFFLARGDTLRDVMLPPSGIQLGRWTIRLSHQRFPALIVMDPRSPRFGEYRPIPYFPVNLSYRFVVALTPLNPKASPDTVIILSTRGNERRALRVGWFDVLVSGKPCRLEAHRLLEPGIDEKSVSVFFRDATSGSETYGVGRYVDPEPLPDGRWVLDFNAAYDPACAFSPHYNCPIPSKANTLKIAIRVGAKDPHAMAH